MSSTVKSSAEPAHVLEGYCELNQPCYKTIQSQVFHYNKENKLIQKILTESRIIAITLPKNVRATLKGWMNLEKLARKRSIMLKVNRLL
jgi:hypothetical protein